MSQDAHSAKHDVVVIGASLGGIEALKVIVHGLPEDFPATVLVVLHAGSSSPRLLADILGPHTPLPVTYAENGGTPEPGHVYIAEPGLHLEIRAPGVMHLVDGPKVKHSKPAADRLFETAADVYGSRVIAVVLTGGDSDGTDGCRAVNKAQGLCVIQNPERALVPDMPLNALIHDHPDFCANLNQIPPLLIALTGLDA